MFNRVLSFSGAPAMLNVQFTVSPESVLLSDAVA